MSDQSRHQRLETAIDYRGETHTAQAFGARAQAPARRQTARAKVRDLSVPDARFLLTPAPFSRVSPLPHSLCRAVSRPLSSHTPPPARRFMRETHAQNAAGTLARLLPCAAPAPLLVPYHGAGPGAAWAADNCARPLMPTTALASHSDAPRILCPQMMNTTRSSREDRACGRRRLAGECARRGNRVRDPPHPPAYKLDRPPHAPRMRSRNARARATQLHTEAELLC